MVAWIVAVAMVTERNALEAVAVHRQGPTRIEGSRGFGLSPNMIRTRPSKEADASRAATEDAAEPLLRALGMDPRREVVRSFAKAEAPRIAERGRALCG